MIGVEISAKVRERDKANAEFWWRYIVVVVGLHLKDILGWGILKAVSSMCGLDFIPSYAASLSLH